MPNCAFCGEMIKSTCPSDDFCSAICQQQWMEGNATWPEWAWNWNGESRKTHKESPRSGDHGG